MIAICLTFFNQNCLKQYYPKKTSSFVSVFTMKFFERKRSIKNKRIFSWDEIVRIMHDKFAQYVDQEIVDVLYAHDNDKRIVILKSEKGYLTYEFEVLQAVGEDEMKYCADWDIPAYWEIQDGGGKPIFNDMKILMKELETTPQFKAWFS